LIFPLLDHKFDYKHHTANSVKICGIS
jgi:hypothetical protein